MNLESFKNYISLRPFITEEYSDDQLQKTLKFAELLLDIFFEIAPNQKEQEFYQTAVFEEAIYLLQNDPTSEYLTKYEGLSQFNVAGAISGSVLREYLPFISALVKKFLKKFGVEQSFDDNAKVSYGYTTF